MNYPAIVVDNDIRSLWRMPETVRPLQRDKLNFRSVADVNRIIKQRLHKIHGQYDLIVGVPRSGLIPANLIALYLNVPLLTVSEYLRGEFSSQFTMRRSSAHARVKNNPASLRVLVVDDSVNSGNAIGRVKAAIAASQYAKMHTIHYLAVFGTGSSSPHVDYVFDVCPQPRIFEWNMFHHGMVENFVFDMDGILCIDGPSEHSNDGGKYENFISSVPPKFLPSCKLGAIVTSRLEKHRAPTEAWLKANGIQYSQLIMLDIPTAEERRELKVYGQYKADVYNQIGGRMFIESEEWQARDIHRITGRPVYCPDAGLFLQ